MFAQRCADGYKSTATGQGSCAECGAGSYCYQTGSPGSYTQVITTCSGNNNECTSEILKREPKCQEGYWLSGSTCTICPDTMYCRGGAKAGNCVSGYICKSATSSIISSPNPVNMQCPINQYCKEAATAGVTCGAGTFNGDLGAVSSQQ